MSGYEFIDNPSDKELEDSMYYIRIIWGICNGIILILALILFLCIYCYRKIDSDESKGESKSISKKSDSTKNDEKRESLINEKNEEVEKKEF